MLRASIHRRRPAVILSSLVLATLGWSQTLAQVARPGDKLPDAAARTSLIATGDTPDLFLLYTGDVIGYLDPCG